MNHRLICRQKIGNLSELSKHLREHIGNGMSVVCPFKGCDNQSNKKSSFSAHLSRVHKNAHPSFIDDIYKMNNDEGQHSEVYPCHHGPVLSGADSESDDVLVCLQPDVFEYLLERNTALMYLKLQTKYFVPFSTIQLMTDELSSIHSLNLDHQRNLVHRKLTDFDIAEN